MQTICQNLSHIEGMLSFSILMQTTQLLCVPQQGSYREMEHKYWNFCEVSTLAVSSLLLRLALIHSVQENPCICA